MMEWPAHLPGHLDSPEPGSTSPADAVWVRGWTSWFGDGPVRVVVRVDGRRAGLARIGCARPDLAALTDHPFAPICGFEFLLGAAGAGTITVSAAAEDRHGERRQIGEARLTVVPAPAVGSMPARPGPRRVSHPAPLRVVVMTNTLALGGATTFVTDVMRHLQGSGFDFRMLGLTDGPHRGRLEAAGMEVEILDPAPVGDPGAYEESLGALEGSVADADVAFVNTLASFPLADAATRRGIPVLWAVHEGMGMRPFWEVGYAGTMHPRVRALAEDAFRHASVVTLAEEAVARLFEPYAGRGRLHRIPYGIELTEADRALRDVDVAAERSRVGIPADGPVIACLGTLEPRKGQAVLVRALGTIADPPPEVLLIGARRGDPFAVAVQEHLDRSGVADRIRIVETVPDPERWLAMSDLVVCASDVEVLPISVLEAMAMGRPVVSTAVAGLPEVVHEGRTGYLCQPCDVEDLARALDLALSHRERWAAMGGEASRLVRSRHAFGPFVARYRDLLRQVAGI